MSSAAAIPVVEQVPVFFDDLDAMGVMHNSRYAVVLERALAAYWARQGYPFDPSSPHFRENLFVVRELTITFRSPIAAPGDVDVELWIDHLGNSSLDYGFRITSGDGSVLHADGRRAQVRIDADTMRSRRIDDDMREAIRPLMRAVAA